MLFAGAGSIPAHDVISTKLTWSQEISRIVYARCASCHRDGGPAPMPLIAYAQVRPWAKAIKEEVHERRMPPWGAMKGFGEFQDDNSLTTEEIHLIADWVEGGAPEGESQYLPPVPPVRNAVKSIAAPLTLRHGFRLAAPMRIAAIAPAPGLAQGASLQAVAALPDGGVVPLLWLFNFQPKHPRVFQYREPLRLPAGTVVRIAGAAGRIRVGVN